MTKILNVIKSNADPVVNLTYRTATSTAGTPAAGTFYSTIVGRAPCVDFSNDLLPRFGVDRVLFQQIMEVQGESGASNEKVYKPINDTMDAVRFVGAWGARNQNDNYGLYQQASNISTDYIEIVFYGTGLNLLAAATSTLYSAVVSVDGGAEGSNIFPTSSPSAVIAGRNYSTNQVLGAINSLALGVHTVKIRNTGLTSGCPVYGYEVLNTSSTIKVPSGSSSVNGKSLNNTSLQSISYNSSFESGTLGTRGGHVVIYQKSDGTIAKTVTPTNASQGNLTSADHTNESIIRTYYLREFGAARGEDFTNNTASGKAYTLDDGTTTLVCSSAVFSAEGVGANANVDFTTLTFVGTGLDVVQVNAAVTTSNTILVDSAAIATGVSGSTTFPVNSVVKIVSGLPYGTHTVRFANTTSASPPYFSKFIVYGPKKPVIPSDAMELADYYLMADYTFAPGQSGGTDTVSTTTGGSLQKSALREIVYTGTLSASITVSNLDVTAAASGTTATMTFFGTGIVLGGSYTTSASATVTIDGALYTGSATVGTGTSASTWTPGTSTWGLTGSQGSRLFISGLSLGYHTIKVTVSAQVGTFYYRPWEIITPVHSPKSNGPGVLQNTLSIGSCAISDNRTFSTKQIKAQRNWAQAIGFTGDQLTSSVVLVPLPDMNVCIKTNGNPIQINYSMTCAPDATARYFYSTIYVDGIKVNSLQTTYIAISGAHAEISNSHTLPVSAGFHNIMILWETSTGTGTAKAYDVQRTLTVTELT